MSYFVSTSDLSAFLGETSVGALHLIRDEWLWSTYAAPGAIPRHLARLRDALARFVLPARRSQRVYPRAVTRTMSNYPRTRPPPPSEPAT